MSLKDKMLVVTDQLSRRTKQALDRDKQLGSLEKEMEILRDMSARINQKLKNVDRIKEKTAQDLERLDPESHQALLEERQGVIDERM
mmetsp:Transcript_41962/g.64248  ORF Transcript_41962/g.64248 Transcript_41962/m.64248 type:complete len:87 (+) Transcript_41962:2741-3001(+)